MMKVILQILFTLFITQQSFAQLTFRTFYTKDNEETKQPEKALYYRELNFVTGSNQPVEVVEVYCDTKKIKLYGYYNNINDKTFVGTKVQAYYNGKIKAKEKFSHDGKLIDTAQYFHPNGKLKLAYQYTFEVNNNQTKILDTLILVYKDSLGQILLTDGDGYAELYNEDLVTHQPGHTIEKGHFKNHKRTGEWTGSFMNGKYTFIEEYQDGQIIKGVSKDSLNNSFAYDKNNYMQQPIYPGGIDQLRRYVAGNYQYPKEAIANGVSGMIRLTFKVDTVGKITNLKIDSDLGYGTGQAAMKALRGSKKWQPGIMRGIPVNVAYTLPLRLNTRR